MNAIKKILVLTDFSENAKAAENYALQLATKVQGALILCNIYAPPTGSHISRNVVWPHDAPLSPQLRSKSNLELRVSELNHSLQASENVAYKPAITYLSEEGSITSKLNDVVISNNIWLVIMGTKGEGFANTLFFGSNVFKVLDSLTSPVLIIPENAGLKQVSTVAYATDLQTSDINIVKWLKEFSEQLHAELLIANVSTDSSASEDISSQNVTKEILFHLKDNQTSVENFYGKNVEQTLHELIEQKNIGILAMLHRKYGFFESLVRTSSTHKMIKHTQLPILVFPE